MAGLLQKALAGGTKWEKEDLLNVMYWIRHIISIACGIAWGVAGMEGMESFLLYQIICVVGVSSYYRSFLRIDEEDFGGHMVLIGEGAGPGTAIFVIFWMLVSSGLAA
mmetsp:Transcript_60573/g.192285  ORF Transcript_60573/g.192285 Transcript_60573/m.192285 type:complete len:108 (+) Transcript_60573:238-561(+)